MRNNNCTPTHCVLKFRPENEDLEVPFQKDTKGEWMLIVWGKDETDGIDQIVDVGTCKDREVLLNYRRRKNYPKLPRGAGLEVFAY